MRPHSRAARLLPLLLPLLLLPSPGQASGGDLSAQACAPVPQVLSSFGNLSSRITAITAVGSTLFFGVYVGVSGYELWKLSPETGPSPVLVASWPSGIFNLTKFTPVGQRLFFVLQKEVDTELWVTDEAHTSASPVRVFPGLTLIDGAEFIALGSTLFFKADPDGFGPKLWWSQKKAGEETLEVAQVPDEAGNPISNPSGLTLLNGNLFFSADAPGAGRELWTMSEAQQNARLFADVRQGPDSSSPGSLRVMGGKLYFTATTSEQPEELWFSTGVDGHAGRAVSNATLGAAHGALEALTVVGDRLFFRMGQMGTDEELWVSDGTEAGTRLVKDIQPGAGGSYPLHLTAVGRVLFFMADDGVRGRELWRSDGTEAGTLQVREFDPGQFDQELLKAGPGVLLLSIHEPSSGQELWSISETGAEQLTDIISGPPDSSPHGMTILGDKLYFAALAPGQGEELFSLPLTQVDCAPPDVTCPSALRAEAVSPDGAFVFLPPPKQMSDNSFTPLTVEYSPAPAAIFRVGVNATASVTVKDAAGHRVTCPVTVTVEDTTGPELVCPERLFEEASGPDGAPVSFPVVAREAVSGVRPLSYSHEPGTVFPLGTPVTVTVTATDGADNSTRCEFPVLVRDTVPPKLTCPRDVVHVATSAGPAPISYPAPQLEDAVSTPRLLEPARPSGSLFELGETEVLLEAEDEAGNRASCRFFVYNVDAVAPTITCPGPQRVVATGPEGAVVAFPEAEAADELGPPTVRYSLEPGSTFPVGETLVTATARDAGGNEASCTFTVTVSAITVEPPAGCGCRAGPAGAGAFWLLLALMPLWARRRAGRVAG